MASLRNEHERNASRDRECWTCGERIEKGDRYINRELRYDYSVKTFSYHIECEREWLEKV